jgi:hypothetical protein
MIAALVALKGKGAVPDLEPVSKWGTPLERCEAASALVRLGRVAVKSELERALAELSRGEDALSGTWRDQGLDDPGVWLPRRMAYYCFVSESVGGREPESDRSGYFEAFVAGLSLLEGPDNYLQIVLTRSLNDRDPDVRAGAVRGLGRVRSSWAVGLLRSRLHDDAICSLNGGGYGWHASVACLAAICLSERGDNSGLKVLARWVDQDRLLIKQGRLMPAEDAMGWNPNDFAGLRDTGPVVALARRGLPDAADVLRFRVASADLRDPDPRDVSFAAWAAYHLARLGDRRGLEVLLAALRATGRRPSGEPRVTAAGCVLALSRDAGLPLVSAPAIAGWGPLFYPDCVQATGGSRTSAREGVAPGSDEGHAESR